MAVSADIAEYWGSYIFFWWYGTTGDIKECDICVLAGDTLSL